MLLQCVANMAVHNENDSILKPAIPYIIKRLDSEVDLEGTVAFQALTNLSLNIAPSQIEIFRPTIQICLKKYKFLKNFVKFLVITIYLRQIKFFGLQSILTAFISFSIGTSYF